MRHIFSVMQLVGLALVAFACFLIQMELGILAVGIELAGVGFVMENESPNA